MTKAVELDDYDFFLSLENPDAEGMFGIKGNDLAIVGHALTFENEKIEFIADITKF